MTFSSDPAREGVRMTHEGVLLRQPSIHTLRERITADAEMFLVTHMGLAEVDPAAWRLGIDGLVSRPLSLTLGDLGCLPRHGFTSVHECAGSPLTPREPKRRVANVRWAGVPLAAVLDRAGVQPQATFVWAAGLEWGSFAGVVGEPYVKDLPLSKVPDALLATHINDMPLPAHRGAPVRLVVPGWYGTNSVKWLGRLTLADRRAPGPFTTRFYNDPAPGGTRPVWGIASESVLVAPAPDAGPLRAGRSTPVWGWAWAERGVQRVEMSDDDGLTWRPARVEPHDGFAWQRFEWEWQPQAGKQRLMCRCFDRLGNGQPVDGARNAIHWLDFDVEG